MGKIRITEVQEPNFGKCIQMENDLLRLLVTVDFGPRIIYCGLHGHDNIMYQDPAHKPLGEPYDVYEGDLKRLYGGHRLWAAPEFLPRCYHPDNAPVAYKEIDGGMEFTAPIEKHSQLQKSLAIVVAEDISEVEITHKITNHSLWEVEMAPWAITMLAAGGVAAIPLGGPDTGVLPNRRLALWDYTNLGDGRLTFGNDYVIIRQSQDVKKPLKLGLFNYEGFGAYFVNGQAFFKFFDAIDGDYPDFGCNFELYTNESCLESETLGELALVESGESVIHTEVWQIFPEDEMPQNETAAKALIQKYLEINDENS